MHTVEIKSKYKMSIPKATTGDLGLFDALLYDPSTRRVVHADTNRAQGTTGLFGAPALDTATLATTVSTLRRPETYNPVWFGPGVTGANGNGSIILGYNASNGGAESVNIGVRCGVNSGARSTNIGLESGGAGGDESVNAGWKSGLSCGIHSINLGTNSGGLCGYSSVNIGTQAGDHCQYDSINIGTNSGSLASEYSINLGHMSFLNTVQYTGTHHINIGVNCAHHGSIADNTICIGSAAGAGSTIGSKAVLIGCGAAENNPVDNITVGAGAIVLGAGVGQGITIPDNSFYTIKNLAPVTAGTPLAYTAEGQIGPMALSVETRSATEYLGYASGHLPQTATGPSYPTFVWASFPAPVKASFTLAKRRQIRLSYDVHIDTSSVGYDTSQLAIYSKQKEAISIVYTKLNVDGIEQERSFRRSDLQGDALGGGHDMNCSSLSVTLDPGDHTVELLYHSELIQPSGVAPLLVEMFFGMILLSAHWVALSTDTGESASQPNAQKDTW